MAVPKTDEQEDFIIVSNTEKPVQKMQEKPFNEPKEAQKHQHVKKAPAEKEPVQEAPVASDSQEKKEKSASRRNRRNKQSAATAESAAATPEKPAEPTQKPKPSRRNKEKANPSEDREEKPRQAKSRKSRNPKPVPESVPNDDDEFDLSDITAREQTREEIIAAAEAAAYGPQE